MKQGRESEGIQGTLRQPAPLYMMLDHFSALRSERTVEISPRLGFAADGPNWAGAHLGRTRKEGNFWAVFVFGSDLCLLAHLMLKPYSFTVSYDLSLILIAVMFKGFNYFCCTYYYQHYVN